MGSWSLTSPSGLPRATCPRATSPPSTTGCLRPCAGSSRLTRRGCVASMTRQWSSSPTLSMRLARGPSFWLRQVRPRHGRSSSVDGSRSCIHCSLLWLPPQAQVRVKLQEKAERRGYPDPAIMRCSIVGRMAEGKVQSRPHYVDRLSTDTSRLRSGGPLQSRQRPSCAPSCAVLAHANNLVFHL